MRPATRGGIQGHLAELEGWRAPAALGVLLTHVGFLSGATGRHILPGFLARGHRVAIFFVLSGFLLYRPWARRSLGEWATDRLPQLCRPPICPTCPCLASRPGRHTAVGAGVQGCRSHSPDPPTCCRCRACGWSGTSRIGPTLELVDRGDVLPCAPPLAMLLARRPVAHSGGGTCCSWASPPRGWIFRLLVAGRLPAIYAGTEPFRHPRLVCRQDGLRVVQTTLTSGIAPVAGVSTVPWHLYGLAACMFLVLTTRTAGPYDLSRRRSDRRRSSTRANTVVTASSWRLRSSGLERRCLRSQVGSWLSPEDQLRESSCGTYPSCSPCAALGLGFSRGDSGHHAPHVGDLHRPGRSQLALRRGARPIVVPPGHWSPEGQGLKAGCR